MRNRWIKYACTGLVAAPTLGVAQERSNVSISGIIDAGITYVHGQHGPSSIKFDSGIFAPNLLTIKGTEDLGGGSRALFELTSQFDMGNGLPEDVVKGGVSISGLFDLEPFRYSWLQPKLQLNHDTIQRQSPLFHIPADTSRFPILMTLGGDESEEFHRQSRTFADAWRAGGALVQWLDQPGKNHFTALEGFESPQSALCQAIHELITTRARSIGLAA